MVDIIEDHVEIFALEKLEELGWEIGSGPEISPDGAEPGSERASLHDVVLLDRLRNSLRRINKDLPLEVIDDAIHQITHPNNPSLIQSNREIHRWIVNGVKVSYQKDGETRGALVKVVDFSDPHLNDFFAVNQFTIVGLKTRRPDVIGFVNGLPLALFEFKNPADENADIWNAYNQIQTYKEDIPDLFHYNEICVISDGLFSKVGSLTTDRERYSAWRTIDGEELDPLGDMRELETTLMGLFNKSVLLNYIQHYILFENTKDGIVKKIAGYHQYYAVEAVVQSVRVASAPGGDRKGGVVWHTQGSGKSIEMTCLAGRLMVDPSMKAPTILMVTDRNDLDNQLFGVFADSEELLHDKPEKTESRKALREALSKKASGGIIFTTMQKFSPGEDEDVFPVLSERSNIIVICDEAHRTQYGFGAEIKESKDGASKYVAGYAQHLRDALPQATYVAFTGTPVSNGDRDTRSVFGETVHIYDIQQAVKDGATVPIYYESRLAKLNISEEERAFLDESVEELTEDDEADESKTKQFRRWSALEKIVGSEPRIKKVAEDFVKHFESRLEVMDGKAMFVGMSRDICAHLYNEIVKTRPEWHDQDPKKGVIKVVMTGSASDKALLQPHIYSKKVRDELAERFKDPSDPFKIVIVRDMWLTGFDAPCMHTMYIDKQMQGHNLMQAIARVNRVFKDKPGGLIVDYISIASELKKAQQQYTNSKGKGKPVINTDDALAILKEKVSVLRDLMHGYDYSDFKNSGWKLLPGAANHVLGLSGTSHVKDGRQRFADNVLAASKSYALCCTLAEAYLYRDELAFFQAIKSALTKRDTNVTKLSDEAKEHAIRQIIGKTLVSDGVLDIFKVAGLDKPQVSILSEEFMEDVRRMKERNLAVELLERLLKDKIKAKFKTNIIQQAKFSDLLDKTLIKYQNRAIETAQVIEELIELAKEFEKAKNHGEKLGLNDDETAFYDALLTNEASVRELGDDVLKTIAVELTQSLRKSLTVDWSKRDSVKAAMRIRIRTLLAKYKYPHDKQKDAVDLILRQAENLSEEWVF